MMGRTSVVLAALMLAMPLGAQDLGALVEGWQSDWAIYREADAPETVLLAAEELQRIIRASTGAELAIVEEPVSPMICLGDNAASREAGVTAEGLPDDGFRIRTAAGNLYIVGSDRRDSEIRWRGWTSRGTLYGTYDFLERVVGVRWLLPGEIGEDIPRHQSLTLPALEIEETPDFEIRSIQDIQQELPQGVEDPRIVATWLNRQKMPAKQFDGWKLGWGHSWNDYISEETLAEHPEWRAIPRSQDRRWIPARHAAVKYCTTNQEMIRAFADGVMKRLAANPANLSAAISPSDGGAFCTCEDCAPFIVDDPHGWPSFSKLVLRFYNDVAEIVCERFPERQLPGYVYYNYMYPPDEVIQMHPNVWLVFYGLRYYGWGLAKPTYAEEFADVVHGWARFTDNLVYGSYTVWMRNFNGAPLPPPRRILKMEMPIAHEAGYRGSSMVGIAAWGTGAPINYIMAKLCWDASADVDALFEEWLQRAYGPGAPPMRELFTMLEQRLYDWKEAESIEYRGEQYEVNRAVIEAVYLPVFGEMERLYLDALSKVETAKQQARLEMFGDNLIKLHHDLREAGMLDGGEDSHFSRTDEQYEAWRAGQHGKLSLDPRRYPIWEGEWSG